MPSLRATFCLFLLSCSLTPPFVAAQQAPRRDPQAINILAQTQSAMAPGGGTVQDAVLQGSYTDAAGNPGTIVMKCKGASLLRNEVSLKGVQYTVVVNRGKGYTVQNGQTRKLPLWTTQYLRPDHIPAFWRVTDYAQPNTNISYLGLEEIAGQPAHHIRLTWLPTDGTPPEIEAIISEFHVFVDSQTGLVVKTWSYDFSPEIIENRSLVETYYSDYRSISGQLIPFHSVRFVAGKKFSEVTLSSVQLNAGLSDSEFK